MKQFWLQSWKIEEVYTECKPTIFYEITGEITNLGANSYFATGLGRYKGASRFHGIRSGSNAVFSLFLANLKTLSSRQAGFLDLYNLSEPARGLVAVKAGMVFV